MPSTPPPLPHSLPRLTPWPTSTPHEFGGPSRIGWPAILVSALLSLVLVAGAFAWIAAHPRQAPPPLLSLNVAAADSVATAPEPPPPPQPRVFSATPAFHHSSKWEAMAGKIPSIEVDPSPLPPLEQVDRHLPGPAREDRRNAGPTGLSTQPAGESYGTQVLFLNNRDTAADLAHRDHKLLFVMHISGNFEDACFT